MKIKSIYYPLIVIAIVVACFGPISCQSYLDLKPISSFGTETVFGNVENAEKTVLGAYERLAGGDGFGVRLSMYYSVDDDLFLQRFCPGDNSYADLGKYNITSSNNDLAGPFNNLYNGIERANQCVKYIPLMNLYANGTSLEKSKLKRLYGEALTIRAEFYFLLITIWGDVPEQRIPSADMTDLFLKKTDRDTIYDHLLKDLQIAEDLVPWRSGVTAIGGGNDERITKAAVKALRARIALFRGGYSLRKSMKMERGSNYLDYYKIAAAECLSIIQSGEHALNKSYRDLWQNQLLARKIDPSGEVIFQIAMAGGVYGADSQLGKYNGNAQQNIVALPSYFYKFDSLDVRRDVTLCAYALNNDNTYNPRPIYQLFDGKFRHNWFTPFVDKTDAGYWYGIDWPVIRYSDVLLMYAEAENEINNGPTPAAVAALNQVRKRAFAGNEAMISTPPSDKVGFFNFIVDERALEFGDEGIRKYDLIRWNLLTQKINETRMALDLMAALAPPYDKYPVGMYFMPDLANRTGDIKWLNSFYKPRPAATPPGASQVTWMHSNINKNVFACYGKTFTPNHSELYPIPKASIDANPNLTQDYGY